MSDPTPVHASLSQYLGAYIEEAKKEEAKSTLDQIEKEAKAATFSDKSQEIQLIQRIMVVCDQFAEKKTDQEKGKIRACKSDGRAWIRQILEKKPKS